MRATRLLGDRRFAICLGRIGHEAWVLDVDEARRLHRELGEAIHAAEQLAGEGELSDPLDERVDP